MSHPYPPRFCSRERRVKDKSPITTEIEKAFKAAFRLLHFRPRSVKELSTRLQKKFGEKTSRTVIQELQEKKLLDDGAFSRFWIENRVAFRPMGKPLLIRELLAKGVAKEVIQEALRQALSGSEREMAERLLAARRKRMNPKDPGSYGKLYGFLRRRGFAHELVSELLEEDVPEPDDRE